MKIVVSSTNPVKIAATEEGFAKVFPDKKFEIETAKVPSGVPDQPHGDEETLLGAKNRVENARKVTPQADYYVGIEGGITDTGKEMWAYAWIVIEDNLGKIGKTKTALFELPKAIADLIRQGHELGTADDIVFKGENTKQKNGAIGILTKDQITRTSYYVHAVIIALIPFHNPELY